MQRRAITVSGIVQGVGFRPFVFGLATRLQLFGFARNDARGVIIEVQGTPSALDEFLAALSREAPTLARIEAISSRVIPLQEGARFEIRESDSAGNADVFIAPDVATCGDCLRELFDPADRRYRYPFINCTNCGPRLTIVTGAPYDRASTTMASFTMCEACRSEYENPLDRRFHAQPIACAICGPRLRILHSESQEAPLTRFAAAILRGEIGALKGLGGFHLVCDGTNDDAISRLRSRKHRAEKPFAIMVRDVEMAAEYAAVSTAEAVLLQSSAAPIVLLQKLRATSLLAPGNPRLGVMLPYTPLHHLLMDEVEGRALVMTSGNRSDEPISRTDEEALEQLGQIADIFLTNDRPIHVRCDDSVTRILKGGESPLRRSRGYAPQPIPLPFVCAAPILGMGGQLKGTFTLARAQHAFVSHHLGDLDHFEAQQAFVRDIALYRKLFQLEPECIAHDLHPDYVSTRHSLEFGDLPRVAVQHHHAHMASCMAENGLEGDVIGVTFDGTGLGADKAIWGGELLTGGYLSFQRAGHFRYVAMPGGDRAIREPWRMALAHLLDAGADISKIRARIGSAEVRTVSQMIERELNSPMTSSVGRLFDAVAAIAGIRDHVTFEGQAAMELEALATGTETDRTYPFDIALGEAGSAVEIDTRSLIAAVHADAQDGIESVVIARRFHSTMAEIIGAMCAQIRTRTQLDRVVLSGGVFMNALLTCDATDRLTEDGFKVYRHRLVPPNDGGLSLGQVAVAAHTATGTAGSRKVCHPELGRGTP